MRITLAVAVACLIGGVSIADDAHASMKRATNIPAQNLGEALQTLAKERDVQVVYFSATVDDLQTQGAAGEFTTNEALEKLLSGTGLTYRYLGARTVTILRVAEAQSLARNHAGQVSNAEEKEAQKKSFWDQFRVAQAAAGSTAAVSSAEEGGDSTTRVEEIVVTAQKRQERLIDVPQSVSVLSADALARTGATQLRDFADTIPGLNLQSEGAGLSAISLRGVTVGKDAAATVGIYVDDIPFGSTTSFSRGGQVALDAGLFDLERIEVLRGPQGTLYGASSMGGLLKYVTRQPDTDQYFSRAQLGIASTAHGDNSYQGALTVNAPIAQGKAAFRGTGFYTQSGGYVDNLALGKENVDSADIYGGRAELLLTPTDPLRIRISAFLQNVSRDGFPVADFTRAGPVEGDLDQRRLIPEPLDQHFRLVSADINYDLQWAALTSVSSYQTLSTDYDSDVSSSFISQCPRQGSTCSAVGVRDQTSTDKFTQEVRLASRNTNKIEWLLGGFYTRESSGNQQSLLLRDLAGQPLQNDLFTFSLPSHYEETAAFGDLTVRLTDRFDVTGGVRFSHTRQSFEQIGTGLLGSSGPHRSADDDVFTYLANARYHFTRDVTGYVRYATGYRPGGPNFIVLDPNTGLPAGPTTFNPDRLKSYEAGFKAELADGRFGIDLAGYKIDWDDIIVTVQRGVFSNRENAPGGAAIHGAELSLTAHPVDALNVSGAFSYQHAEIEQTNAGLRATAGQPLPTVPRYAAALNMDYTFAGNLKPTAGAAVRYVDERNASFGDPVYRLPAYTSVDLRAGLTLGSVDLQLYARNLFDERGELTPRIKGANTTSSLTVPFSISILQPRTIGLTLSTQF